MKGPELRNFWEWLSSSLWVIPGVMILLTFVLAVVTLVIDENISHYAQVQTPFRWVYTGSPEGAWEILSTIAGSMINIAALSFSITLITLTLASSQYGHRLLRRFVRDYGTQLVLGIFVSTFLYSLIILRFVRTGQIEVFVPHISVTTAMILAIISVGALIFFIHHIVSTVQVENLVARIGNELKVSICQLYPPSGEGQDAMPQSESAVLQNHFQEKTVQVEATKQGYIQTIDYDALLDLACTYEVVIKMNCRPGQFITPGGVLVELSPAIPVNRHMKRLFQDAFTVGKRRTNTQDIEYVVEQLSEIAVRALSTGINSPYTAVICIDYLRASLSVLVQRAVPETLCYDSKGNARLIIKRSSYRSVFDQAFNPIRQTASNVPVVMTRMLEAINEIGRLAGDKDEVKAALRFHATMIYEDSQRAVAQQRDREDIQRRYQAAMDTLR